MRDSSATTSSELFFTLKGQKCRWKWFASRLLRAIYRSANVINPVHRDADHVYV